MDPAVSRDRERKKAVAEMLVLGLLAERSRHGYELAKLIERRSNGVMVFHVASLYTLLQRLEGRGLIRGRWLEQTGARRRRFYTLTEAGERALGEQRQHWRELVEAIERVAAPEAPGRPRGFE